MHSTLALVAFLTWGLALSAQTFTTATNFNVGTGIPDAGLSGLANAQTVSTSIRSITGLKVTLNLAGSFNGDLYSFLVHSSGRVVLLNRVGKSSGEDMGYGDSGFNMTFDDSAANGDVHNYRLTLNGSQSSPIAGALTNVWSPDGRTNDPASVLDTDPRTTALSSFNGLDPNGEWVLYLADMEAGDLQTLSSWGLEITGHSSPTVAAQPVNQTVECSSGTASFNVTAQGTAPLSYTWRRNGTLVPGGTSSTLTISNATSANAGQYDVVITNSYGSITSSIAALSIVDTTLPVVTLLGANPLTNECHAAFTDPGATASDSCAGTLNVVTNSTVNPNTVSSYTITYTATDPSGNTGTATRTVYVVDRTAPVVTLVGANPLTNECHTAFVDPGAIAGDTCAGTLSVVTNSTVNPNAVSSYTITYTATDPSGNIGTATRIVYVVDRTAPVVTLLGSNPLTNECHTTFTDPGATASDTCAGTLSVVTNSTVNPNAVSSYLITYTATDPSGNTASATRTVYVVDRTTPVITMLGANPLTNECHTTFTDPGATASDTCAGTLSVVTNSTVNPNTVSSYTITYTATDPGGNTAAATRTVYIVDRTAPVVTLIGANPLTNECHTAFTDPGATANDPCAGTLSVVTNNTVNPNAVSSYTITYTATDPSGNTASATRTVWVVDRTAPVVTLLGANPLTNECHIALTDPGATASDTCAGTLSVVTNSTVNPNAVSSYTITYTATDPSGNTASATRTVYVVDRTAPVVTLLGANPLTNECHTAFTDPGATASDTCAGTLTIVTNSTVNPNAVSTYTITYTATDPSGNIGSATRTVYVRDRTAPVVTLLGANPLTNECHIAFTDPGATASDTCAGTLSVVTNSTVNPNAVSTYTITYTATDPSGNTASATRTVYVVDRTAPVVTLLGANPLTNECHIAFTDPGATASDTCAGTLSVVTNSTVNPNAVSAYTITYTATDPSGNTASVTRTVYVVDRTAPVVTMLGVNPLTNECHTTFTDPGATASDTCAGTLSVVTNNSVNPNAVSTYTITYTATDPSGNTVTATRTVYIRDRTAPVVTLLGANPLTNECHTAFTDPGATASDTCAGTLSVVTNSTVNPNAVATYTITYTATDPSGNIGTASRTVYIKDTTPPAITCSTNIATVTTNASGTAVTFTSSATDLCSGSTTVLCSPASGSTFPIGTTTVNCTASDPSGNATNCSFTVTVLNNNHPPTATNFIVNAVQNHFRPVPLATFIANAADQDNDPLTVSAVSPASTNGGTVTLTSTNVIYTPVANFIGVDLFTYSVSDGKGGAATASVIVQVTSETAPGLNRLSRITVTPGGVSMRFVGIPGYTYTLQRSSNLTSWTAIGTLTVPDSGIIDFIDSTPLPGKGFYRTVWP